MAKVTQACLEKVEQPTTKEVLNEIPFFLVLETPVREKENEEKNTACSFSLQNNTPACYTSCCRCTQWLSDSLKGQCNWVWEESSPKEWLHVCLCDICDTERISCLKTYQITKEKNSTLGGA